MSRPVFLSADWRHLCLFNFEIAPDLLTPYIPYGTELDSFDGKTYVSLVSFMFYRTKLFGIVPAFFHGGFEEINLRFYVLRKDSNGTKRGVVFIKEIVPKPFLAWVARQFYKENYVAMPTESRIDQGRHYEFQWGKNRVGIEGTGKHLEAPADSAERWITEHYWGYTKLSAVKTYEYEVKHPIWDLYEVKSYKLQVDFSQLYGNEFAPVFSSPPRSVFLADGSGITVHWPRRVK